MDTKLSNLMVISGVIILLLIPSAFLLNFFVEANSLVATPVSNSNIVLSESDINSNAANTAAAQTNSAPVQADVLAPAQQPVQAQAPVVDSSSRAESKTFVSSYTSPAKKQYLGGGSKIAASVQNQVANDGKSRVIVTLSEPSMKGSVLSDLKTFSMEVDMRNGFAGYVESNADLKTLEAHPSVGSVIEDMPVQAATAQSFPQINLTSAVNSYYNGFMNLTGEGQVICIIDTGVEYNHDELGNCTGTQFLNGSCPKVIGGWNIFANNNDPGDDNGHGTAMAGLIAANGSTYKGIAPGAKIVAVKVTNSTGGAWTSLVDNGIDWCVGNASLYNITAIYIGLSSPQVTTTYSACDAGIIAVSANSAVANNISVFAPTGNNITGVSVGISSPACVSNITSVSAVADGSGSGRAIDLIPNITRDGWTPNRYPGMTDLMAPGSFIDALDLETYGSYASNGYGTSFAGAHVAGATLILNEYNLKRYGVVLTPLKIREIFQKTGKQIYDDNTSANYSRIDIYAAVNYEEYAPVVNLVSPANSANEGGPGNVVLSYNVTDHHSISQCALYINGTLNQTDSTITSDITQNFTVNFALGSYSWKVSCDDTATISNNGNSTSRTLNVVDLIPPASATSLSSTAKNTTWVYWTWTNPADADFDKAIVFINNVNVANTSNSYYNATGLNPSTAYTIKVHTKDTNGNVNNTDVTNSQTTDASPDTTPPATITGLSSPSKSYDWVYWTWTNPADADFDKAIVFINNVNVANISGNSYNATGLSASTLYTIKVHTKDTNGNVNNTDVTDSQTTNSAPDTTPPAAVTGLSLSSKGTTSIEWTWTNPADADFDKAIIYIDGTNVANISGNTYNATGFSPNTSHTIKIHTKDATGNVNSTDVIDSQTTDAVPDTTPPASVTGLSLTAKNQTSISWGWTNPADADFSQNIIFINNVNVANTSNNYYTAAGLNQNTTYTIKVHTKDATGNVNNTDVTDAQTTLYVDLVITYVSITPDPIDFTQNYTTNFTVMNTGTANVTNSFVVEVDACDPAYSSCHINSVSFSGINAGASINSILSQNLSLSDIYNGDKAYIAVAADGDGEAAELDEGNNIVLNNMTVINMNDTTPPATITGLSSSSNSYDWIYWSWTNPGDSDFSENIIFINSVNVANTSNNYYNATGLASGTDYTINVHTKDAAGNVNSTDVTDSQTTDALPDLAIETAKVYTKTPAAGNWTTFQIIIRNIGSVVANNIYWLFDTNYTSPANLTFGPFTLQPNETVDIYPAVRYNSTGTYNPVFTADYMGSVIESNESNNQATIPVTIN